MVSIQLLVVQQGNVSSDLMQFMDANNLQVKDLDFADIEFTYESDDGTYQS